MNKVYRVIWNSALGAWVAASELASRQGAESVSSGQTRRVWQAPYLLISLVSGIVMSITPLAHATQATKNEIPLCTTSEDCKNIVVAHADSPRSASVSNTAGWYLLQNRKDNQGATTDVTNLQNYAIAVGDNARAGDAGIALGSNANTSSSLFGTAVGAASEARGNSSVAIGPAALSEGSISMAMGRLSYAKGFSSMALGSVSTASADMTLAMGNSSAATGLRAIAIGSPNITNTNGSYNQEIRLNTKSTGVDAIALGTAANSTAESATAIGKASFASGVSTVAVGTNANASKSYAIAVGDSAQAFDTYANALGASSNAFAPYSNALGFNSQAVGAYSFAEGKDTLASGYSSTAIGNASKATNQQAIAIGLSATSNNARSIAIGAPSEEAAASNSKNSDSDRIKTDSKYATQAAASDAIAIGSGAQATDQYSVALGTRTRASSKNTVALGNNAVASGLSAIGIGNNAQGKGFYSVAIAENSNASGDSSVAIGNKASSSGEKSISTGYQSTASGAYSIAVGLSSTASATSSIAVGNSAAASGESALAAGVTAKASGEKATALGGGTRATGINATAVGYYANSSGASAIASGYSANALAQSAIAMGDRAYAYAENTLAIGRTSEATKTGAIAFGQEASASAEKAIALGAEARSDHNGGVALGDGAKADRAGLNGGKEVFSNTAISSTKGAVSVGSTDNERQIINVAGGTRDTDAVNLRQLRYVGRNLASSLGGGAAFDSSSGTYTAPTYANNNTSFNNVADALKDVNDGAVKYDRSSNGAINKDKVSFEGGSNGTTLDNVASGTVASGSKQAVNGSQLYTEQTQRQKGDSGLASALGGGAKVADDGTVTAPTYTVHSADGSTKDVNNVGDALTNVDQRTDGNTTAINNINSGKAGLVQQESAGKPVTVAKDTDGTEVTFADKNGKTRTLSNVSAGKISSSSTDAVNGSQLYGTSNSVANALGGGSKVNDDGTISNPTYTVHNADGSTKDVNNVGDALTNVDQRINGNTTAINNINSKAGLVQQESAGKPITVAKDTDGSEVTFADKDGKTRTLSNVSAGNIASSSTDAVNGSQLYGTSTSVANALGGGSKVNDDGTVTQPTYSNNGTTYHNMSDALKDVNAGAVKYDRNSDGSINTDKASLEGKNGTVLDNVANGTVAADSKQAVNGSQLYATNQAISSISNGKTGLVQQAAAGEKITVGKDTDGTEVSFADKNGGTRRLTNVTDGQVSATSKEAVNGSQLHTEQAQRQKGDRGLADALGGGAKVTDDGTVTAPTYTVHNADGSTQNVNNVGDAVSNLDGRTADNTIAIHNIINGGNAGIVQQETTNAPITVGKSSGGTEVTFADKDDKARKLTNVSKGKISSDSQDAINGSQLSATSISVANALGGGAKVNDDGTISSPTYTVNGNRYTNAGDAIHALGGGTVSKSDSGSASATGNNSFATGGGAKASGNKATAVGDNAAATHSNSVALGAGSKTDRDNTVSIGSEGNERAITNVADGTQPHDAATVGQMSRGFGDMSRHINKVDRDAKAGTASAMAMSGLPQAVLPGRSMLSAGGGTYEGQSAVAVGLSTMTDNGRWIIKGQVSGNTQGDVGGAVGVGFQW